MYFLGSINRLGRQSLAAQFEAGADGGNESDDEYEISQSAKVRTI